MARVVFVTWDGGGNLPPALGIARVLAGRGHVVEFLGHASQRERIGSAGFAFRAYADHDDQTAPPGRSERDRQRRLLLGTWMSTRLCEDLERVLVREPADLVVVDYMLAGVLAGSDRFGAPTTVLAHSLFEPVHPMREQMVMIGNRLLADAGQPTLDPRATIWEDKDLVLVATLAEFDGASPVPQSNVRYVGPVFDVHPVSADWTLPWHADDPRPLALVSFSTMPGQTSAPEAQDVLDALGSLPLRVLVTTGGLPADTLSTPANTVAVGFIPHSAVLPHAAVAINHAGHGSVMQALAHGVPMVCRPSAAADQPVVAARVEALGAGKTIPIGAAADDLRNAVQGVVSTPAYGAAATRLGELIARAGGPNLAADEIERRVSGRPVPDISTGDHDPRGRSRDGAGT